MHAIRRRLRFFVLFMVGLSPRVQGASQADTPAPSAEEIFGLRTLPEPLVPGVGEPTAEENRRLVAALADFERRGRADDFSALESFLGANPHSPWQMAVRTNLGLLYFRAGYFSKCVPAFLAAWAQGKHAVEPRAKALACRAAGEYAVMLGRLGRFAELKDFLRAVRGREFVGQGGRLIQAASQGAEMMERQPEIAFRCGPMALSRILASQGSSEWCARALEESKSTMRGISLNDVAGLSRKVGLNYRPAKRAPGAELVMPAVIHWKAGHYAALIRQVGERYLSEDPTFGRETWHTREALEEEASGYFLVPEGPLLAGWSPVGAEEAGRVFGKGSTDGSNADATSPMDHKSGGCPPGNGMAGYSFHTMLASLSITDTPVGYDPPYGHPVWFTASYAQREASQPANFNFSNLGPKWNFNWLSYIVDDPSNPAVASEAIAGGGTVVYAYSGVIGTNHVFVPQFDTRRQMSRPVAGLPYTVVNPDGSREIYGQSDGSGVAPRRVFLTQRIDPHGNTTTLSYDGQLRITTITDALGQQTAFTYGLGGDPFKVSRVTDPFGRYAEFFYDGAGRLIKIRDVIGIESAFAYEGAGDFIKALTTPYGTTTFAQTGSGRNLRVTATDPAGDKETIEACPAQNNALSFSEAQAPQGLTGATEYNQYLYFRNSFHWDKKQWKENPGNYTKAHIYHWLHDQNFNQMSRHLESEKEPLSSRIWYSYPGQSKNLAVGTATTPTAIGRVVEGGTQITRQSMNPLDLPLSVVDPLGRHTTYTYATNDIDLLTVTRQPGAARYTAMNAGGGAVGAFQADGVVTTSGSAGTYATNLAINTSGVSSPAPQAAYQSERWGSTFSYLFGGLSPSASYNVRLHFAELVHGAAGQRQFNAAINGTQVITNFDIFAEAGGQSFKAVVREFAAAADAGGQVSIQFTAGAADLPKASAIELVSLAQPPGPAVTLASFTYNAQHLPLTYTDAGGRTTFYTYNANGQLTSVTNAENEATAFIYYTADAVGKQRRGRLNQIDGALPGASDITTFDYDAFGRVASITGSDGYVLAFTYDALDRPVRVTYPDGTYQETAYAALDPRTSRDRLGRVMTFTHNSVRQLVAMTDPANRTTSFAWCLCGGLRQVVDPMGRMTAWKHDINGRMTQRTRPDGSSESYAYQPLSGRLQAVTDERGQVRNYGYNLDDTLAAISYSNASVLTPAVAFSYDSEFRRLVGMTDGSGTTAYGYHPIAPGTLGPGRIASEDGPLPGDAITYGYDALGRVTNRAVNGVAESVAYDAIGRATSFSSALGASSCTYVGATRRIDVLTHANGMTSAIAYHPAVGDFRVQTITHTLPGSVPVGQHTYGYDAFGRITSWTIKDGALPAVGYAAGYDNSDRLVSFASSGSTYAYGYDAGGNRLAEAINGSTNTSIYNALDETASVTGTNLPPPRAYTWDAESRLVAIDYTGTSNRTELSYDGIGRCFRIIEKSGAAVTTDRRFIWGGLSRCEERDAGGTNVVRRFFPEGEQIGGQPQFYAFDHLGTVWQTAGAGSVDARYAYDPWGRRTKLAGSADPAAGFTGHFTHAVSGLALAPFRAYDAQMGRWLSRDPIPDSTGRRGFLYVLNDPVGSFDPDGLKGLRVTMPWINGAFSVTVAWPGVWQFEFEPGANSPFAFDFKSLGKSLVPEQFRTPGVETGPGGSTLKVGPMKVTTEGGKVTTTWSKNPKDYKKPPVPSFTSCSGTRITGPVMPWNTVFVGIRNAEEVERPWELPMPVDVNGNPISGGKWGDMRGWKYSNGTIRPAFGQ